MALHTPQLIKHNAQAVYQQVVVLKLMPLNNATPISDAERAGGEQEIQSPSFWPMAPEHGTRSS